MRLYAVTLAGIPGRIVNDVLAHLRTKFSDRHVFRGAGVALRSNKLTMYNGAVIDKVVVLGADAVFGRTMKPWGFCRLRTKPCALVSRSRDSCIKSDNQSCQLTKPSFFVLIYQQGVNEIELLTRFHHSAYAIRLPRECYNKKDATISAVVDAMTQASKDLGLLNREMRSGNTPLLLPPFDFERKSMNSLFHKVLVSGDDLKLAIREFKATRLVRVKPRPYYSGRNSLGFPVTPRQQQHGTVVDQERPDLALSKLYRLGCQYEEGFHYDVFRQNGSDFDGSIRFFCRRNGAHFPKGTHVNVYVDDCLR